MTSGCGPSELPSVPYNSILIPDRPQVDHRFVVVLWSVRPCDFKLHGTSKSQSGNPDFDCLMSTLGQPFYLPKPLSLHNYFICVVFIVQCIIKMWRPWEASEVSEPIPMNVNNDDGNNNNNISELNNNSNSKARLKLCMQCQTSQESRCRHCNEYETLPHVLGFCRKGELLRNNRHHWVRSRIAECLKKSGKFDIYEEVHCISSTGSTKRADIIAIDNNQKIGFIIDPTIRFEGAELQPQEIDLKKKRHYEPYFPYLEEKYHISICRWKVIGLLFGARSTISRFCINFFHRFHIDLLELQDIAINILRHSLYSSIYEK
ncbi:hypothetical protein ANN_23354 [Periplaneta americana]|uniref:Uncharacterized protein n=1 Tax=Periplaneta americana TaxID=6978 RepID=A0ABQ8SLB0_PERAM|nr:hypothetical protein ANN_23354 [Periplaneta americana]